ncbi:MAG TPA: DUF4383 domain-containing protein [Thermomicrobiales bacterium]|nr:DUF4383 domain-containing protein [Thermomicrobiales bacterium]
MTIGQAYTRFFIIFFTVVSIPCVLRPLTDAKGGGLFLGKRTANALGLFRINWFHAVLHMALAVVGLTALGSTERSRMFARLNFIACAILVAIGLTTENGTKHIPANRADDIINSAVGLAGLVVGFTPIAHREL